MTTEAGVQGEVTVHDFPGLLGTFGWGWLHPRFMVLEHSVLLVYASEEDWAEHREPMDDIALSADSTVELSREGGETLVRLRCPSHAPLTFAALVDDSEALTSKIWRSVLVREISRLRRESVVPQTRFRANSWRFWNPLGVRNSGSGNRSLWTLQNRSSIVQDFPDAMEASERAPRPLDIAAFEGARSLDEMVVAESGGGPGVEEEEKEESAVHTPGRAGEENGGRRGDEGGNALRDGDSGSRVGFRRWPLRRYASTRNISNYGDNGQRSVRQAESSGDSGGEGGVSDAVGRGGKELWGNVRKAFRTKNNTDCECKWCRVLGSSRHSSGHLHTAKIGSCRQKTSSWGRKGSSFTMQTFTALERWEHLVSRWIALQLARSGDTSGMRGFLEKFPDFSDKANLLRAAIRYRQYSLVQYFLDEQHMDVNLVNSAGIPLVWFSVLNFQKGDSGVMLRYLLQRGADMRVKSNLGQNVLFLVAFSRGKEAIPTLKYLVEEFDLSLTERDNFGSEPIHWAVLHGHLDTVQWISRYTRHRATRADWAGVFQKMENIRLVKPEHMGAARSWRMRGLQKSARSLTPLGVAILHNHEDIAKWLMGYASEDPRCVSCKRENLFSEENRDLALVAKTWPELLPEVLQGFEVENRTPKSSWDTDDRQTVAPTGWSERTYDLKLLYGSPQVPANRSPLNIFLSTEYPRLFEVKVVQMVVALKWSVFGQRYYLWELSRFLALSLSFILGFILWGNSANWLGNVAPDSDPVNVIGGSLCRIVCWVLTLFNLLVEEGRELKASKSFKKYILDGWNLQSVVAYVLILSLIAVFRPWTRHAMWGQGDGYTNAGIVRRLVTAPAALFLFTRCMEHLAVWKSTGIFIAVIRMVIVDTSSWAVIFILFEVGFALSFYALLEGGEGFTTVFEAMVSVFVMSMGEISTPFSKDGTLEVAAVLMFILFMLLVTIVYLNLLVAMMTTGYTKVVNGATAQAMMNRAAALVKWEGIMTERERLKAFNSVAPGRGKRSHVTLKSWFGGGVTELFCSEEGATAVEPEQSSIGKLVDPNVAIMKELAEMREMIGRLSKRGLPRSPPGDDDQYGGSFKTSSDSQDASFRRRQAGMLDANGNELSRLRITDKSRSSSVRRSSAASMKLEDVQEWRRRAREIEEQANSRRGVVRAQALVRGYLSRSRSKARFFPGNK